MKKLMIAACAFAFAASVQAAIVSWSNQEYTTYAGGIPAGVASGETMYLIQSSAHSQDSFISMVLAAGDDFASIKSTVAGWKADYLTAGEFGEFERPPQSTTAFTAKDAEYAYVVLFDDANKNVFMSADTLTVYNGLADGGLGGYTFNFDSMAEDSASTAIKGYTGSQGAGWYAVESVPEPTSGLLLLLGVAGLALRRRRA